MKKLLALNVHTLTLEKPQTTSAHLSGNPRALIKQVGIHCQLPCQEFCSFLDMFCASMLYNVFDLFTNCGKCSLLVMQG